MAQRTPYMLRATIPLNVSGSTNSPTKIRAQGFGRRCAPRSRGGAQQLFPKYLTMSSAHSSSKRSAPAGVLPDRGK